VQSDGRFVKVQWSSVSLATTHTEWRQRVSSKVPRRLAKNVKVKEMNIFQTTCIKM